MIFNPFDGIQFHPAANKFTVTIEQGGGARRFGIFNTLDEAVAARAAAGRFRPSFVNYKEQATLDSRKWERRPGI
ncbi:MAG: hypothetical protein WBW84_19490 [Acidobacteriaceae bacterium]